MNPIDPMNSNRIKSRSSGMNPIVSTFQVVCAAGSAAVCSAYGRLGQLIAADMMPTPCGMTNSSNSIILRSMVTFPCAQFSLVSLFGSIGSH